MKKTLLADAALIGVSAFLSVSLVAAGGLTLVRSGAEGPSTRAAGGNESTAAPLSWDEAAKVLAPAVPPAAKKLAAAMGAGGSHGTGDHRHGDDVEAMFAAAGAPDSHAGGHGHGHATSHDPGSAGSSATAHGCSASSHGHTHAASTGEASHANTHKACPASDGTVSAAAPDRTPRRRTKVVGDPTGQISPWEINYESAEYAEDGCGYDVGPVTVIEVDPSKKCTMTHGSAFREGNPKEYFSAHGGHDHQCRVTKPQYDSAFDLAQRATDVVGKTFDNQPWVALQKGYLPFPVPGTKTVHMFHSGHYGDRDPSGNHVLFDVTKPEMFTYGMTDQGLVVVNVVFVYAGNETELPEARRAEWFSLLPRPYGCMVEWHGHYQGAEGPATGNVDGRDYMTHVWTWPRTGHAWEYGEGRTFTGVYPYGEYGDGSEPHGWFTAYRAIPAFCNKDGGCI